MYVMIAPNFAFDRSHLTPVIAALFHDPFFWLTGLTGLSMVGLAFYYLRCADGLAAFINRHYPDLLRPPIESVYGGRQPMYRLDNLILFGRAGEFHPDDPDYRRLLHRARWAAASFLAVFLAGMVFLAKITPVF